MSGQKLRPKNWFLRLEICHHLEWNFTTLKKRLRLNGLSLLKNWQRIYISGPRLVPLGRISKIGYIFQRNGFTVDYDSGTVKSVTIRGITRQVNQEFLSYRTTSSGAYLFRPYDKAAAPIAIKLGTYALGSFVDEYHQVINTEVTQITRVYKGENDAYIEFDWLVGNLQ